MNVKSTWIGVAIVAGALIAGPLTGRPVAAATAAAIEKCTELGTRKAVGTFVRKLQKLHDRCVTLVELGQIAADCDADLYTELGLYFTPTAYNNKVRGALDAFHKQLAAACRGEDHTPYTADDVGPADLSGGVRFPAWGAELTEATRFKLLTQFPHVTSFVSTMDSVVQHNCIAPNSLDAWLSRPKLQRLLDVYQCLAVHEALALSTKSLARPGTTWSIATADIVPASIVYDAGGDFAPFGSPDGTNDRVNIPVASGCPLPGIGRCAADPNLICTLAPGGGSDPASGSCPPFGGCAGCPLCIEDATGPDGVTAADMPAGTMERGKCITALGVDNLTASDRTFRVSCTAEGINNGSPVNTSFAGTCEGGPWDGIACINSDTCADLFPPSNYQCISGDEYACNYQGVVGSNLDNSPPCGAPCLVSLVGGPPSSGCGTSAVGLCIVGTCVGGVRPGQVCDILGIADCPGGFCDGVGNAAIQTGDEVGYYDVSLGGMDYFLCPAQFELSFPMDVRDGTASIVTDLTAAPLHVCLPDGADVNNVSCSIREPGVGGDLTPIGFFTGPSAGSANQLPCPNVTLPRPYSDRVPLRPAVGPVIGVSGVSPR